MSNEEGGGFLLNATVDGEFSLVATQKLALEKDHNYSAPNGSMVCHFCTLPFFVVLHAEILFESRMQFSQYAKFVAKIPRDFATN